MKSPELLIQTSDIPSCVERVYQNSGNLPVVNLIPSGTRVLDCGCGGGDNARLLKERNCIVTGITLSPAEQKAAMPYCDHVYVGNLEQDIPEISEQVFDVVIMSHVLEHLVYPQHALTLARKVLAPGGSLVVALPNVLFFLNRLKLLLGAFEYTETGLMDKTHMRFYTFESGKRLLTENGFSIISAKGYGTFPLWKLRSFLSVSTAEWLSRSASTIWPGFFGYQSVYLARPIKE